MGCRYHELTIDPLQCRPTIRSATLVKKRATSPSWNLAG
jgi:hypothetical protein